MSQTPSWHRIPTEASSSNTPSTALTLTTRCWSGRRCYQSMGSVQHSMPAPIPTSSKPILESNSIMKATHTSEPFRPTSSFAVSTSSTSSLTDSPSHHTNSVSTLLCPLARPSGYSSKSTHIWCTFETLTVNCFRQTNLPHLQPPFRHSSMVQLEYGSLLGIDGSQHIQTTTK